MSKILRSDTPIHLEYRNATYYGQISQNYKRNGKGMLILDTSTVIFADWKQNQVEGDYIYITDGIRAYGTLVDGKLDGYNIITSVGSSITGNTVNNKLKSFYGMFRNGKVYGCGVMIDNDSVLVTQFNNNQLEQILSKRSLREKELYQLLSEVFPNNIYTMDDYLTKFIKHFIQQIEHLDETSRFEPCINHFSKNNNEKFYGFQQINKENKKFGILMMNDEILSIGEHNNNLLQGIGRLYKDDYVYDGAFRNGKIDGIGIEFHSTSNKFLFHVNDSAQNRVEKGFGFPLKEIVEFRKQFHLRSVYFYNDVAMLGLKSRFDDLILHIFNNNKRAVHQQNDQQSQGGYSEKSNRSASKRLPQNYSPLRQRLSKMEPDFIEDNSPIKNTYVNEYRPVDRASTYFQEQNRPRVNSRFKNRASSEYSIEKQDMRNIYNNNNNNRNSYYENNNQPLSRERNEKFSQEKNHNKLQDKQQKTRDNNRSPAYRQDNFIQQTNYNKVNNQRNSRRSSQNEEPVLNGQIMNRTRKHTKDLVKQLQNQQKQRRLTLDQIYEKSGLYGRNYKK